MQESHSAANRQENNVITGPGYPEVFGESPNRTYCASVTAPHTTIESVMRRRFEYRCCQRAAVSPSAGRTGRAATGGWPPCGRSVVVILVVSVMPLPIQLCCRLIG